MRVEVSSGEAEQKETRSLRYEGVVGLIPGLLITGEKREPISDLHQCVNCLLLNTIPNWFSMIASFGIIAVTGFMIKKGAPHT